MTDTPDTPTPQTWPVMIPTQSVVSQALILYTEGLRDLGPQDAESLDLSGQLGQMRDTDLGRRAQIQSIALGLQVATNEMLNGSGPVETLADTETDWSEVDEITAELTAQEQADGVHVPAEHVEDTTDRDALDAIATLLGTSREWSSAADFLEDIANLVGTARPHPGDSADTYRADFLEATGRPVPTEWDNTDEDEDEEDE